MPLPVGFVRRPSGEAVLDPDEQVRAVVHPLLGLPLGEAHEVATRPLPQLP
nr:hypothetical protein [Streptomyces sp. 846.5]